MKSTGPLFGRISENLQVLASSFEASSDYYCKKAEISGISCAFVLFTGISSPEKLSTLVLRQLCDAPPCAASGKALIEMLLAQSIIPVEPEPIADWADLTEKLSGGMTILLVDGTARALAISTQEMPQRSITTPEGEGNINGSQEGFTELLRTNIALLRRQFRSGTLCAEIATASTRAKTEYCLCYDKELAPPVLVQTLRKKLQELSIPILLDSTYFDSFFKGDKLNLFPAAAHTERPATACARLCEGKVVVLVAGSPNAMVVPGFFSEHFESLDDYSSLAVFAGMIRLLKYAAFFLAVFGPALYLLAVDHLPEMIPMKLLAKLAEGEASTPLPLMLELLLVMLLLEIVREAGLRAPKAISNTVSLAGALLIGETAVSAGVLSIPVLTVAAASMIATLAVPSLYAQTILFRFALIFLTGLFGLPGFAGGTAALLAMAAGSDPFGYDYLYPLVPAGRAALRDGIIRAIWSRLAKRGYVLEQKE